MRKGRPHQGDDARESGLMHLDAIKEPLNHDDSLAVTSGTVYVEQYERLPKPSRELVSRFVLSKGSPGIGHQHSVLIVDWESNPPFHGAFSRVVADSEVCSGLPVYAAIGEIRMMQVKATECKAQRFVILPRPGQQGRRRQSSGVIFSETGVEITAKRS